MPGIVYDSTCVIDVASAIVTGCGTALTTAGFDVGRTLVTSGEVAWDLCDCGQLAATIVRSFSSASVATDKPPTSNCSGAYHVVELELSYVHCVPISDVNGNPPSTAALTQSARDIETEKFIIRDTVLCLLNTMKTSAPLKIADYYVSDQLPLGPTGGCGGSRMNIKIAWIDCYEC